MWQLPVFFSRLFSVSRRIVVVRTVCVHTKSVSNVNRNADIYWNRYVCRPSSSSTPSSDKWVQHLCPRYSARRTNIFDFTRKIEKFNGKMSAIRFTFGHALCPFITRTTAPKKMPRSKYRRALHIRTFHFSWQLLSIFFSFSLSLTIFFAVFVLNVEKEIKEGKKRTIFSPYDVFGRTCDLWPGQVLHAATFSWWWIYITFDSIDVQQWSQLR